MYIECVELWSIVHENDSNLDKQDYELSPWVEKLSKEMLKKANFSNKTKHFIKNK